MDEDDEVGIVSRDAYLSIAFIFILLFALFASIPKPPVAIATAPSRLKVDVAWNFGNTDVDLLVLAPDEPHAVSYSRKSGKAIDLLRDDLGDVSDPWPANEEEAETRGVNPGEYTVNLHCYRCPAVPQVVWVRVSVVRGTGGAEIDLVTTSVTLTKSGQEKTAVRFHLNADGTIRPGSMNAVFRPLRSAKR